MVRLQVDGGLKTGVDVVKAAVLGADSFGFGTAPMLAMGCKYLRVCHLNNCATVVATQNDNLRKRHFVGTKERVVRYFRFVASEVREILASMGKRSLDEVIGRPNCLKYYQGQMPDKSVLTLHRFYRQRMFQMMFHAAVLKLAIHPGTKLHLQNAWSRMRCRTYWMEPVAAFTTQ